jgi:hypothetical protein
MGTLEKKQEEQHLWEILRSSILTKTIFALKINIFSKIKAKN